MLVKCSRCQSTLKVSDDKLTAEGIRIKCPKCSSVLLVKEPAAKPTEQAPPPPSAQEEAAPPEETAPPEEEEFKLDLTSDEEVSATEEETAPPEEGEEEFKLDLTPEDEVPAQEDAAAPAGDEAQEDLIEGFDDSFEIEQTSLQEESTEPPTAEDEEFQLDLTSEEEAPVGEEEQSTEEFQLDSSFDIGDDTAELSAEAEGGDDLSVTDNTDFAGLGGSGESVQPPVDDALSLKDERSAPAMSDTAPGGGESSLVAGLSGEPPPVTKPPARKPPKKEVTGYGVSTRRSMPAILPVILIIIIIGAVYISYTELNKKPLQDKGELTIYDYTEHFVDNDKEGKLLIIVGKVKNDYKTERRFIKVKGALYDDAGTVLAAKTVYAGNIPTELETKKLPIEEIDKLLNRKMGEELSNMNVSPGTSIGFKIVFANVEEERVTQFKVTGAGSQAVYK